MPAQRQEQGKFGWGGVSAAASVSSSQKCHCSFLLTPSSGTQEACLARGACHILRPQDSSLCHTTPPLDWGRVMLSFLPWLPLHEILGGRECFLASSHHPSTPLRAQPTTRFLASGARAAEPSWSEPLRTSLLPLSVGHLWGDFL